MQCLPKRYLPLMNQRKKKKSNFRQMFFGTLIYHICCYCYQELSAGSSLLLFNSIDGKEGKEI